MSTTPIDSSLPPWRQPLDHTLFIEASAGTGKTWTLAMLYLRLVLERGLLPARILVVTFTEAATAELRTRLRHRLVQALELVDPASHPGRETVPAANTVDPALQELLVCYGGPEAVPRLRTALENFDTAAIHTLHGFCARVLGDASFRLGLPPIREWGEDPPGLVETALADRLRRVIESLHPRAAASFSPRTPEKWLKDLKGALEADDWILEGPGHNPSVEELNHRVSGLEQAWQTLRQLPVLLDAGAWKIWIDELLNHAAKDGRRVQERWLVPWCVRLRTLLDQPELPSLAEFTEGSREFTRAQVAYRWHKGPFEPDPLLLALWNLQEMHVEFQERVDAFAGHRALEYIRELPTELRTRRLAQQRLSFNDLLLSVRDALAGPGGPELARDLQQRYPATLVDEFQDTDPVQWQILKALAAPDNCLVLVGDPKQAIYGFRGGDVHAYLRARDDKADDAARGNRRVRLDVCQRSDEPLIAALNTVFQRPAQPFRVEGIPYDAVTHRAPVRLRRRDGRPAPALELVLPPLESWTAGSPALRNWSRLYCVDRVRELLSGAWELHSAEGWRPLRGGDLAVLTLTHRQASGVYQALLAAGIPALRISQESVWESEEAQGLRPVLLAMLEPGNPARLLGALAGGLCEIDGPALETWHRSPERLAHTAEVFGRASTLWSQRGVAPALALCLDGLGIPGALLARPDGARCLTNLRHLQELLLALEHEGGLSPADLLVAFDQRLLNGETAGEQALLRLESDQSLVQVATVHASKGLEYPLVLAPFLWDEGLAAPGRLLAVHDSQGRRLLDGGSPLHGERTLQAQEEQLAERLRLCYVALTRARHSLMLVCAPPSKGMQGRKGISGLGTLLLGSASTLDSLDELEKRMAAKAPKDGPAPLDRAGWLAALDVLQRQAEARCPGCLQVVEGPEQPGSGRAVDHVDLPAPRALPLPGGLERRITVGSFTGLSAGNSRHGTEPDDSTTEAAERLAESGLETDPQPPVGSRDPEGARGIAEPTEAAPGVDLRVAPGQAAALGIAVHGAFEKALALNGDPSALERLCRQALGAAGVDPGLALPLAGCVQRTLDTALPGLGPDFRLAQLAPAEHVHELEFLLPLAALDTRELRQALDHHQWPPGPEGARWRARLDVPPLAGYLKGFVDLVFQAEGRWHVLDWKSNQLGPLRSDYGSTALDTAMAASHYYLQGLFYAVALFRLLRLRLPGFDPARHLGGLYYLFVRGIRPGGGQGIWHTPLPVALLADLDRSWYAATVLDHQGSEVSSGKEHA